MRILIANDQHWPMKSGVATAGRTLAQGMAMLGHEVMVLAPSQTGRGYEETDVNYHIVRIRSFGLSFRKNLRVSVPLDREINRIISDFDPDIVHVHTQLTVGLAVLRAAVKRHIPVVATNHAMPENMIKNIKLLSRISRPANYILTEYGLLLYKGAKHIVMPTESGLALFNLARIETPTSAISNGINLEYFLPIKAKPYIYKKFEIPKNKLIISYLGRLDGEKHIEVMVKAAASLIEAGYDFHVVMVGDGNAAGDLHRLVEKLGIEDRVTFTGLVSDEDLRELHRVGDIYTMPSPTELQCITLLEAMASGKPVVAVNAGALSELCLDGKNGYLVEVDDPEAFAVACAKLLDHPERRISFGRKSRMIAESHDVKIIMPQFEKLYKKIIAENS
jgi:1,2-diacylglycerol 3-alpha-glucosyltransferase